MGNFEDNLFLWENAKKFVQGANTTSPTKAQLDSLDSLTKWLDKEYGIEEVGKHNDYNTTDCPGNRLEEELDNRGILR